MSSVLWLQGGACSGNTMSFLNAEEPSVVDLIVDFGLELLWHPSLGLELGENAQKIFRDCVSGEQGLDIFVFEGTVIEGPDGSGRVDMFADRPMKDWVIELANAASIVVAIGDCAAWGGIPAMEPNPSASTGLQFHKRAKGGFLGADWTSKAGLPVINIPGCPAHPDWITQILVALATGRTGDIALDDLQRPETFFKTFTQTGCTRVQFFEYKQSTTSFGIWRGDTYGLPVLRVRLPWPDDALAVQPHPVEPAIVQDPGRHAVSRLHRTGVPLLRSGPGHGVQDSKGLGRDPEGNPRRFGSPRLHGPRCGRTDRCAAVVQGRHVRGVTMNLPAQLTSCLFDIERSVPCLR